MVLGKIQIPLRSVENGVLSVTGVIKKMGEPLAGLNQKQLELVISTNKLNVAQASALLQGAKVSRQDRIQILKKLGLISATAAQDVATKGLTLSMKQLTAIIWAQVKAWAMTPFGMATIAAAAIFAIVKIVDALTVSLEESREALADLREEYKENEDEIATLNDELQTTIDRINELQGKDSLTFTEAEELDNLRKQNAELERQIALLETVQKQKMLGIHKTFIDVMEKDVNNVDDKKFNSSGAYTTTKYDKLVSENYEPTDYKYWRKENGGHITRISEQEYIKAVMMRREEVVNSLSGKLTDKERESLSSLLNEIDDYLTDKSQEFADAADGISYVSNPTTSDEKAVNEWLDFINDFNDQMMIAMGQSKAKENAFNRLIYGGFSNATSELKNLGKQGEVTAKHLADSRYDAFIQKCIDLGIIADDSEGSLEFLASGFNLLSEAVGDTGDGVDNTKKKLNGLADSITNLQDAYTLLDKAMEEMEDGGLTVDTIKEIAEQVDNLTDYLYIENGVIKLNTQAWREYAKAKVASDIAGIQASIKKLEDDNKALDAKKKEYEANRAAGSDSGMWNNLIIQQDKAIAANNKEIAKNQELLAIYNTLYADITDTIESKVETLRKSIKAVADEYNNFTNGNVDYNKRPVVSQSDMRKVYPEFSGDYATTYSQYHTIGEGNALYTIDITPILEDGTVLSQEALDEYVSNLITDNGVDGVLASDTSNLIINIQPGDYDEEYWSAYQETLGDIKDRHLELVEQLKTKEHNLALDKVAKKMSGAFEQLDTIYADIVDKKDFDWESILNNQQFEDTFGDLGEVYDDFIKTVANSPDDISACQSAFDNLATAYILHSGALKGVTHDTRNATIAMLEQMGVANAAALVDEQLAINKETARLQSELKADATHKEVLALYDEETATRITAQAIFELAIAKIQTNENAIVTSSDIDQLEALAKSAGASTESLLNLAKAKALMAEAEGYKAASDAAQKAGDGHGFQLNLVKAQAALKKAEEYYNKPITYDVDFSKYKAATYTGGSKTGSAKDKSKEETWFEKQLSLHQHLVAMNQETQEEYLAWLNTSYKQAYDEGIIELNDYYKYAEEVYSGLHDLFKDYLSDVEHEISMRENYDGEAKKIIELYEGLIKKVEKEIAAARDRGLTDEDDYIQELQKKWQDYTGSIKDLREDITDAAKDALDELIDYRIDMLKKEVEAEKDALDKRLDNLKEFYDKQKEMLQDQRDEENYLKDQSDKRKTITDLQAELAMLENDDSAWAQKRKLELQEEITTAQEDLDEFEKDHALDLALDALDKAYNDQEAQLQAEMDALEERLNDPEALYNKALEDIRKNSENQLYYQMLMYNKQFGDGNDETVKDLWESAFGALSDYEKLFGELYKGVNLENETGVEDEGGWDDETISGTNPDNQQPTPPPPADDTAKEETTTPQLTDDIKKKVAAAIWNGGYGWGTGSTRTQRLTEVFGAGNGIQALVNKGVGRSGVSLTNEYTYANMRKKFKGYASGTDNATPGWHELFEGGLDEYIFTSSDGSRYRMFSGLGDKVLNGAATDFLYDFANSGGTVLTKMLADLLKVGGFGNITKPVQAIEIHSGDVIVQGNATERTVSEIRRAQRDNLEFVLKELNRLNK